MVKLLGRLWAGIVGALAGASLGLVLVIVLLMMRASLDVALWMVAILAMLGGIVGFVFGNKKLGGK